MAENKRLDGEFLLSDSVGRSDDEHLRDEVSARDLDLHGLTGDITEVKPLEDLDLNTKLSISPLVEGSPVARTTIEAHEAPEYTYKDSRFTLRLRRIRMESLHRKEAA